VKLLLDTHVLLWWLQANERLTHYQYALINAGSNEVFVSAATV